jgi:pyridoxine/pyridoxamine 5'-phosphate oxidase
MGADLSSNPVAALTFYCLQLVRQVRVHGAAMADPREVTAADFWPVRPVRARWR